MIKNTLIEANRYEDIINILNNIIKSTPDASIPVNAFVAEDGKTKWEVDGKIVVEEAKILLQLISGEDTSGIIDFKHLDQFVRTKTYTFLHNYAVAISHRKESNIDIDVIRSWEILDNLIINFEDIKKGDEWHVPDGWKKIESDRDNSNIKIGDTVKVISTTIFNNKPEELIPIGSICKVTNIEYDSYAKQNAFELLPINHNYRYWYLEKEIEKGHMEWVKNE